MGPKSKSDQGQIATDTFQIYLDSIGKSHSRAMKKVLIALEQLLRRNAPKNSKGQSRFKKIHEMLYTPERSDTFLVQIIPREDSPVTNYLTLLFRWSDLYFIGYHCKNCWYLLADVSICMIPPKGQLPYNKKEGIFKLPIFTSYSSMGGSRICVGPRVWQEFYDNLMSSRDILRLGVIDMLITSPFSLPAVTISEYL